MKLFGNSLLAVATAALAVAPAMAAPINPAASLSIAKSVRASTHGRKQGELAGGGGFIIAVVVAVVLIAGVIVISDGDDDVAVSS